MFLVRLGYAKAMLYFNLVIIADTSSVFGEVYEYVILFGEDMKERCYVFSEVRLG